MKKRLLASLLCLCLLVGLLPTAALAVDDGDGGDAGQTPTPTRTTTLDLTADSIDTTSAEAEGWAWDAETKTLTLNGLNLSVSSGDGIVVPDGATIVLAAGSVNTIKSTVTNGLGIAPRGSLTVKSADPANLGTLDIDVVYRGIELFITEDTEKNVSYQFEDVKLAIKGLRGINLSTNISSQTNSINVSVSMKNTNYTFTGTDTTARGLQVWTDKGCSTLTICYSTISTKNCGSAILLNSTENNTLDIKENSTVTIASGRISLQNATNVAALSIQDSTMNISAPNTNTACIYVSNGNQSTTAKALIDNSTVTLTQNFTGTGNKACLQMVTPQTSTEELCELIIQNGSTVTCDNKMPGTYNFGICLETAGVGKMQVTDSTVTSTGYTGIGFGKSNDKGTELHAGSQELIVENSTVTATGFGKAADGGYGSGILMNTAPYRSTELTAEKSGPVKVQITNSTVTASSSFETKDSDTAASGITLLTNAANVTVTDSTVTADSASAEKTGVEVVSAGTSQVQVSGSTISSSTGAANESLMTVTATGDNKVTTETGTVSAEKPITLDKNNKLTTESGSALTVTSGDTTATYTPAEDQQVSIDPATGTASTTAGSALTVTVGDNAITYTPDTGKTVTVDTATGTATTDKDASLSVQVGEGTAVTHKPTSGGTVSAAPDGTITLNTATGAKYSGKGETLPTVKDDGTVTLPAGAVVTLPNGTTYTVTEETNLDLTSHNEHTWDAGVVTTAPSYSSTGTRTYACTICGETKTETIPALTGGGGTSTYAVSVDSAKNGSVTVSPKNASRGSTVTITVKPDSGYELDALTVTDSKGSELKLTDKGNGKYTFTMPASKVTVEVTFVEEEAPITVPTFVDVPADAYFADAVAWAVENDITNGTSATTFSPNMSCTRAQMVTFLWRAAGSPKATGNNPFTDLDSSAYYYDAVLWAIENGVTNGTSATTFSPDATVTRGQTVTFLYRANGSPAASGNSFADVSADSYYADAVAWAVAEAITNGTGDNTFSPDADCTRGQIVTFLYRDAA